MCDPLTAQAAVATAVAAPMAMQVLGLGPKAKGPGGPGAPSAPPAGQASRTPDQAATRQNNSNAGPLGAAATMLTGPTGVSPDLLSLGKNTLLGS